MQNVFRERTNLSLQLKDSKTIVGRLQFVLGAMLQALGFFIYLLIFNVSFILAHASLQGAVLQKLENRTVLLLLANTAFTSEAIPCCRQTERCPGSAMPCAAFRLISGRPGFSSAALCLPLPLCLVSARFAEHQASA